MTDQRPRPQYGEYATPEEQIAAGGPVPEPVAQVAEAAQVTPAAYPPPAGRPSSSAAAPNAAAPTRAAPYTGAPDVVSVAQAKASRPWDRGVTAALLAFGAYSVVSSIPGLIGFSGIMTELYSTAGYGEYTNTPLADGVGVAIIVAQSVLFIATVWLSVRRLRAGRVAFFVPLAGGAIAGVVIFALLIVAMAGDPALAAWVDSQS